MTDQRLDAMTPRKRGDRTYWIRIGSAWPNKQGIGYQIVLDALPLTDNEGRCVINLFQPKAKDSSEAYRDKAQPVKPATGADFDDEIPWG